MGLGATRVGVGDDECDCNEGEAGMDARSQDGGRNADDKAKTDDDEAVAAEDDEADATRNDSGKSSQNESLTISTGCDGRVELDDG